MDSLIIEYTRSGSNIPESSGHEGYNIFFKKFGAKQRKFLAFIFPYQLYTAGWFYKQEKNLAVELVLD